MNNLVENDIIDMNTLGASFNGAGIHAGKSGFTGGSMSNNIITGNVVYSTATAAPTVWITQTLGVATIAANFYWNAHGLSMSGVPTPLR